MSQIPEAPKVNKQKTKSYYVQQGIPAELPEERTGKIVGSFSIVCAIISFLFYPIIFGPIGIGLGIVSRKRGARTLGLMGIILSAVLMVFGMILGFLLYDDAEAMGNILFGLF